MYIFSIEAAAPTFSNRGDLMHSISISKKNFPMCHVCMCVSFLKYWKYPILLPMKEVYDPLSKAITILHSLYVFCTDYKITSFRIFGKYSKINMKVEAVRDKCLAVSTSLWPHGLYPTRLLCPQNSPGKNTGVESHSFLQEILPI